MEMSFSEIRAKEVVNVADGRKLGKICDMVFCYPENRILGFVVPGTRAFGVKKTDFFIELKNIVKIGDDVILVNVGVASSAGRKSKEPTGCSGFCGSANFQARRSYEEYE